MLSQIRTKLRYFIPDIEKTSSQIFTYTTSNIFTLQDNNASEVTNVTKNGNALESGQTYTFDSTDKTVTVDASLIVDDIVTIYYKYYDYSDIELNSYIHYALAKISASKFKTFRIQDTNVYPKPTESELNLIALIAAILLKPNYSTYRLPTVTVQCPEKMSKDEKIDKIIDDFSASLGFNDLIDLT